MKLNEMILVTENWKGTEINALMTFEDYKKQILFTMSENMDELTQAVLDLCESWRDKDHWSEIFFASNKSVNARYCNGEEQLRGFLMGYFNSTDQECRFDEDKCSKECLEKLSVIGIKTNGRGSGIQYKYELVEKTFSQGESLHNFNGNDYRVLERLSARNLMLLNERNGEFVAAIGVSFYVRFPEMEAPTDNNLQYGIEWSNGLYLGRTPSTIDFEAIREKYGDIKSIENLEDYRKEVRSKFRMYRKIMESPLLNYTVKEAAQNAMYEEFSTGKEDTFYSNLSDGKYDHGFYSEKGMKKDKVR